MSSRGVALADGVYVLVAATLYAVASDEAPVVMGAACGLVVSLSSAPGRHQPVARRARLLRLAVLLHVLLAVGVVLQIVWGSDEHEVVLGLVVALLVARIPLFLLMRWWVGVDADPPRGGSVRRARPPAPG